MFVLPIEAGFVGADNVGVLLAEEPYKHEENQLIIDIGTNGELVLGNRHKLISSSCATGPALEGAQIAFGMRAAPGAMERIIIDPETKEVDYKVIGREAWRKYSEPKEMKAKGICGSGILDLLAELYRAGVIAKSGVFNKKALKDHPRFRKNPDTNQPEFVLAWADVKKRVEANWCSGNVEYIELTVEKTFQQEFMEAMQLPHMTDEFPHLEGLVDEKILKQ
jgi:uncharacterized 2Fe-2S/4Fe-4S cluster protein (DUF4445 family)